MSMKKLAQVLFVVIVYTSLVSLVHAQVQSTDLVLSVSPQYPGPNQNVTASISSYVTDLNKAHISWSVNNQDSAQGVGKKVFSFTTGASGTSINLSVTINTVDGQSIQKSTVVTSSNVDMLWEADDAYVPPFYRGKALAPSQGIFKVVAMPNLSNQTGKINMDNLSYIWSKDGDTQADSSGWGKNYFTFTNSYLDKGNTVSVKASDITGGANTFGTINLSTSAPHVVFYRNDPDLGEMTAQALENGFSINSDGETIVAEPFFFSPKDIASPSLDFKWYINGSQTSTQSPKNILSVKPDSGQSGEAEMKLVVENTQTLFQSLTKTITVQF